MDADRDGILSCHDCDDDDDDDYADFPESPELCDGLDNDCDPDTHADPSGEADDDGDGALSCEDRDDLDPLASPGFPAEELCDGADNRCAGALDPSEADVDQDGWLVCTGFYDRGPDPDLHGGGDCNDLDSSAWPGGEEFSTDDVDCNCDGVSGEGFDDARGSGCCGARSRGPRGTSPPRGVLQGPRPKNTLTLPQLSPPPSKPGAPMTTSSMPSPLKSPAGATAEPN